MNAQFVYTPLVESPIVFEPEVLGAIREVTIAGHKGTISLPQLGPPRNDSFDAIIAPKSFKVGVLPLIHREPKHVDWGIQFTQPRGLTSVCAVQFDFEFSTNKDTASDQARQIEDGLELWMGTLRDWLEVRTSQFLGLETKDAFPSTSNFHWSWSDGEAWHSLVADPKILRIEIGPTIPVTHGIWESAIECANDAVQPPDSHLLLRDARARWRHEHYQLSVILAAMAAEIVVKRQIEGALGNLNVPRDFIDEYIRKTSISRLLSDAKKLDIRLPSDLHPKVFQIRNKAIHRNALVSFGEARQSHTVVKSVVSSFEPLNDAGPEPLPHSPWSTTKGKPD